MAKQHHDLARSDLARTDLPRTTMVSCSRRSAVRAVFRRGPRQISRGRAAGADRFPLARGSSQLALSPCFVSATARWPCPGAAYQGPAAACTRFGPKSNGQREAERPSRRLAPQSDRSPHRLTLLSPGGGRQRLPIPAFAIGKIAARMGPMILVGDALALPIMRLPMRAL